MNGVGYLKKAMWLHIDELSKGTKNATFLAICFWSKVNTGDLENRQACGISNWPVLDIWLFKKTDTA